MAKESGFWKKSGTIKKYGNISTGHFKLDFAIQFGVDPTGIDLNSFPGYNPETPLGIPLGKLVELFGEEGGGKSSLAYRICGCAQKMGHIVAWIDSEHSFHENLAYINGLSLDDKHFWYANLLDENDPDKFYYAEDVIDKIVEIIEKGVKVIVLDSVANLSPKAEFEEGMDKQQMALMARVLGKGLKKVSAYAEKYGCSVIFINQLREKPGTNFGDPETTPGGHALKHNCSIRIRIAKKNTKEANIMRVNTDTGEESLIGRHVYVRLKKNRFARPMLTTLEIPIYFEKYFPNIEEIVFDSARQVKIISVRKGYFSWGEIKIDGKENFLKYIKENNLVKKLIDETISNANGIILPPEIMLYKEGSNSEVENCGMDREISGDGQTKDNSSSETESKKRGRKKNPGISNEGTEDIG